MSAFGRYSTLTHQAIKQPHNISTFYYLCSEPQRLFDTTLQLSKVRTEVGLQKVAGIIVGRT